MIKKRGLTGHPATKLPFRAIRAAALCAALLLLGACATTTFSPEPIAALEDSPSYRSLTVEDLTVSVAVLTDGEARKHFGVELGEVGVQALWVRVRNPSTERFWLIRNAIDPDLYSAEEAAQLVRNGLSDEAFETLRQYFRDESIRVLMEPGHVTQGYVFIPREEGGRYVEVRLGSGASESSESEGPRELRFSFALTLPDGTFDYEDLSTRLAEMEGKAQDLDTEALRTALRELPCCVTNADGTANGDPLNVVLVGNGADVMNALTRAGWSFTQRITAGTVMRMVSAAIEGEGYPVAPVSSLYVFGRSQDIALQRARRNIAQRNHMRLWLAPFTHEGRHVWVGQVSRDIGIKVTPKSPSLTTHIIDPAVDVTREYLLHSLLAEGFVERLGFVEGSKFAPIDEPAYNLTDDFYYSDGLRLVVMLSPTPILYHEVRGLAWEESDAPIAEGQSEAANRNVWPISSEAFR